MLKILGFVMFLSAAVSLAVAAHQYYMFICAYIRDAGTVFVFSPFALFSKHLSEECRHYRYNLGRAFSLFIILAALSSILVLSVGERVQRRSSSTKDQIDAPLRHILTVAHRGRSVPDKDGV